MRKLGEQWVEEIDGKPHMVKAVKQTNKCSGCVFCTSYWCGDHIQSEREFDCSTMIIKDLGILNEDGLLPCPFCGEYPLVEPENRLAGFGCHCDKCKCAVSGLYESMEEVIEEWNRRA